MTSRTPFYDVDRYPETRCLTIGVDPCRPRWPCGGCGRERADCTSKVGKYTFTDVYFRIANESELEFESRLLRQQVIILQSLTGWMRTARCSAGFRAIA